MSPAPREEKAGSSSQAAVEAGPAASSSNVAQELQYYLLKAEPDSRIVKGKDVKFSVDDFEKIGTSPWEGVRNYEARNIMKEMKVGDQALFYHSNCKNPGIAAFAEVSKEAYPDYTAWDPSHPYYDAKSDSTQPKWHMVDLSFIARAEHFVPLSLLRYIASLKIDSGSELPEEIAYLGKDGVRALKGMDLVTRGRLSVQRVKKEEWDAVGMLANRGGWESWDLKKLTSTSPAAPRGGGGGGGAKGGNSRTKGTSGKSGDGEEEGEGERAGKETSRRRAKNPKARKQSGSKRKRAEASDEDSDGVDSDPPVEEGEEKQGPDQAIPESTGGRSTRAARASRRATLKQGDPNPEDPTLGTAKLRKRRKVQ